MNVVPVTSDGNGKNEDNNNDQANVLEQVSFLGAAARLTTFTVS